MNTGNGDGGEDEERVLDGLGEWVKRVNVRMDKGVRIVHHHRTAAAGEVSATTFETKIVARG